MKFKFILVPLAVIIAAAIGAAYIRRDTETQPTFPPSPEIVLASPTPAPTRPAFRITDETHAKDLAAEILRTTAPAKPEGPRARKQPFSKPHVRSSSQQAWQRPGPEAPEARYALSYVGADELADQIWSDAINDLSIPPNERKDLIEDLNEDGFPDPHNVTLYDLPLILSRIRLIEEVAPDSLDEVNAEAFAEAYKDLMNMVDHVVQQ